jgi:hypothetical protein
MAEGALMVCMIEFSGICAKEGLHQYLEHRRKVIADGNEDQLISSRVKSIVRMYITKCREAVLL